MRISSAISRTCMHGSIGEPIGHYRRGAATYRRRMAGSARSQSPPGGQDRPEGDGCGAERDLRGRLPRVLVRIPTGTRWAERWRRHEATGDMIIVRYADDIIVGFEHETDARRFLDAMRERLERFALSLHPDKTRLIEGEPARSARAWQTGEL